MGVYEWLEASIGNIKRTGNPTEVHMDCPICGDTRQRLYVNTASGKSYCHNCGFNKGVIGLIVELEGASFSQAQQKYKDLGGRTSTPPKVSTTNVQLTLDKSAIQSRLKKRVIPLPKHYRPLQPNKTSHQKAINYLLSRGLSKRQIFNGSIGYCSKGKYGGRIIIPIENQEELVFWVARASDNSTKPKEMSPPDEDWNISKSEVLYNLDNAVDEFGAIVLCEGIFDAMSFGGIGVAMLGKRLYTSQLEKLLEKRPKLQTIYIALDADATDDARVLANQLNSYFKVYHVEIPKELDDPNKTLMKNGFSYLMNLLTEAKPLEEFSFLRKLL